MATPAIQWRSLDAADYAHLDATAAWGGHVGDELVFLITQGARSIPTTSTRTTISSARGRTSGSPPGSRSPWTRTDSKGSSRWTASSPLPRRRGRFGRT